MKKTATNYEIHHGGNSIHTVADPHVMRAIGNGEFTEVLLPNQAQLRGLLTDLKIDSGGLHSAVHFTCDKGGGKPCPL